jgi:hypothetical protein
MSSNNIPYRFQFMPRLERIVEASCVPKFCLCHWRCGVAWARYWYSLNTFTRTLFRPGSVCPIKQSLVISTFLSVVSCKSSSNRCSSVPRTKYSHAHVILWSLVSVSISRYVITVCIETYLGPKQPRVPFENGTRYFSRFWSSSGSTSQRSGMNFVGSGKITGSRRMKYVDMLTEVLSHPN